MAALGAVVATAASNAMVADTGPGLNHLLFVAPTGADQNPCTGARPCATIARAAQVASAGDEIWLAQGKYGSQVIAFDKPGSITVRSAYGAEATVDGGIQVIEER